MDKIVLTTIDGEEFICPRPVGRTWLLLTAKQEEIEKKDKQHLGSVVKDNAEIISICFRNDKLTPDFILDNVDLAQIQKVSLLCNLATQQQLNEMMADIPNVETTAEATT